MPVPCPPPRPVAVEQQLLETPDEYRFDDLLRAAAEACGGPIALARGTDPSRIRTEWLPFALPDASAFPGGPAWVLRCDGWSDGAAEAVKSLLKPLAPRRSARRPRASLVEVR